MSRSLDGITRSPSIERNLLKGLITSSLRSESDNQKDIFPDVDAVVRQEDFQHDINYAIYSEIKQLNDFGYGLTEWNSIKVDKK